MAEERVRHVPVGDLALAADHEEDRPALLVEVGIQKVPLRPRLDSQSTISFSKARHRRLVVVAQSVLLVRHAAGLVVHHGLLEPSKRQLDPKWIYMMIDAGFYRVSRIHEKLGKFPAISCRFRTQSEHLNIEIDKPKVPETDLC